MIKRSCKGSLCIGYLRSRIDEIEIHHGYTWNDYFLSAIQMGQRLAHEELEEKGKRLKAIKRRLPVDVKYPTAIQVSINAAYKDAVNNFEDKIKEALELTRLQFGLEFELLLLIYLDNLQSQVMLVGEIEEKKTDLTGPEMVKRLVEVLMLNREQDKQLICLIKEALLEWEV